MKGQELKARREALGLTQKQLAEHMELPLATIGRWETDLMPIRHGRMLDLALRSLEKPRPKGKSRVAVKASKAGK